MPRPTNLRTRPVGGGRVELGMTRLLRVEGLARGILTGVPLIGRVRSETAKRAAVSVLANMMIL